MEKLTEKDKSRMLSEAERRACEDKAVVKKLERANESLKHITIEQIQAAAAQARKENTR